MKIKSLMKFYFLSSGNQTMLYVFWPLFKTLAPLITGYLAFGQILEENSDSIPYGKWVASGAFIWVIFVGSVTYGLTLLNSPLRRKRIELSNIKSSNILNAVLFFPFISQLVCVVYLITYIRELKDLNFFSKLLEIILLICYTYLFSLSTSVFVAVFSALARDFKMIAPWLMQMLLFTSPIFYYPRIPNSNFELAVSTLNPLNYLLALSRYVFFGIVPTNVLGTILVNIVVLVFSIMIFSVKDKILIKISSLMSKEIETNYE